jgi:hypothetical protein
MKQAGSPSHEVLVFNVYLAAPLLLFDATAGFLGRGCSMSAPGSRAKRSSSSVKGRPSSLSIASNILRSSLLSSWRAASRSGVSGGDGSSGVNTAINAGGRR